MKNRPKGFLAEEYCPDASEVGDYVCELHQYLWRVVWTVLPNAGGHLKDYVDICIHELECQAGNKPSNKPSVGRETKHRHPITGD